MERHRGQVPEGARVRGKIVSITDYGAFMELEKGIEGLHPHLRNVVTQHIKHPSKIVGIGDIVEAWCSRSTRKPEDLPRIQQLEPDRGRTLPPSSRSEPW